jgi:hypothetical protein
VVRAASPTGALLKREVVVNLRSARVYWALGSATGLLIVVVLMELMPWKEIGDFLEHWTWPAEGMDVFTAKLLSRYLLRSVTGALLAGSALILPALAGSAIVSEKEQDTYTQLRLTLLRPMGVVAAELASTAGFFLALVVFVVPVLGTAFFLVGVDERELLVAIGGIAVYAVNFSLAGLACSAFFNRTHVAIIFSYGAMLMLVGGSAVLVMIGHDAQWWPADEQMVLVMMTPAMIFAPEMVSLETVVVALSYQAMVGMVLFFAATVLVWRPPRPKEMVGEVRHRLAALGRRGLSGVWTRELIKWRRGPIAEDVNPMLAKELRWGLLGQVPRPVKLAAMGLAGLGLLAFMVTRPRSEFNDYFGLLMTVLAASVTAAPALTASGIAKEYERDCMDFLRLTLLTPARIVRGKLWASLMQMGTWVTALYLTMSLSLMISKYEREMPVYFAAGLAGVLAILYLGASVAVLASEVMRRTRLAVFISYVFLLAAAGFAGLVNLLLFSPYLLLKLFVETEHLHHLAGPASEVRYLLNGVEHFVSRHDLSLPIIYILANAGLLVLIGRWTVSRTIRRLEGPSG